MADLLKKEEYEAHTLLTVKEVREVFGIARSTVYRWIDRCWLRKAGQVQAPEDYKNQRVVLLELADADLQEQFEAWVRAERKHGRDPHFFVEELARVDPIPAEEIDPRIESKRLVGELDDLMGRLDQKSEEREALVEDLDALPAIEPSGLAQAEQGLSEIVDLLKKISDREGDLREDTMVLPEELDLPPQARESEEFRRELFEEHGQGLESGVELPGKTEDEAKDDEADNQIAAPLEEETNPSPPGDGEYVGILDKEELGAFAFLADPETLGEEGEWIELNIDELENPLLKEELLDLDESFMPGARRRGVEIDFNKGILSETELDELSVAREAAPDPDGEASLTPQTEDEKNDSWLGISLPAEEETPLELTENPYDPTGDLLEGEELHLLHAAVADGDSDGFYLDGEVLEAQARSKEAASGTDAVEATGEESVAQDEDPAELLGLELGAEGGENWGQEDGEAFQEDAEATDLTLEKAWLGEPEVEASALPEEPMPETVGPETGISESMLTGEDSVEIEPDEEVRKLDEAFEAEGSSKNEDAIPEDVDVDAVLAEVDATSASSSEDLSPDSAQVEQEELLGLDDLEDDALMTLEDLDEALDLAVEIQIDEEEPVSPQDVTIQVEEQGATEATEIPEATELPEATAIPESTAIPEAQEGSQEDHAEPPVEETQVELDQEELAVREPGTVQAGEDVSEAMRPMGDVEAPEEPEATEESPASGEVQEPHQADIPLAAEQQIEKQALAPAPAPVAAPGLTAESLQSSSEMIKEGMIGIRLSILEVKEGLGILQDPVDSVSKNTEKVSEGVHEIANEARETRRALEDLGVRLENLDLSSLRSTASPQMPSGGSLVTGIGLALLVLTWCLGLYLRGQGNTMALYIVFGANLLITSAILMLRHPQTLAEE